MISNSDEKIFIAQNTPMFLLTFRPYSQSQDHHQRCQRSQ